MTKVIVGVDVGNSTSEAAMAELSDDGVLRFVASSTSVTTGIKGTRGNVDGIAAAITELRRKAEEQRIKDIVIEKILLNNATPVIADFAMDTITETIIIDSAMIGHNPDTPGGVGLGTGETVFIDEKLLPEKEYILVIPDSFDFNRISKKINELVEAGYLINGAILQGDEGNLINNRLVKKIPIVDEVSKIENVPIHMPCAVEVASAGHSIDLLSNPYGIASVFHLNAEETDYCKYVAKALIGNRSAVVIKTPESDVRARVIPAGSLEVIGKNYSKKISVEDGAQKIMDAVNEMRCIEDVKGESGTNIGGMIENIKISMAKECSMRKEDINITDIFATDSCSAVAVRGGIADEYAMETGVTIAAMVKTEHNFMQNVADELSRKTNISVDVQGVEAEMALKGALTTPGTAPPIIMIDIGAGSTDAAYIGCDKKIKSMHLAGAGNLITMLINSELHLNNFEIAESVKKHPLARVDNLYRLKYENGDVIFFEKPLDVKYYGQIVTVTEDLNLTIVKTKESLDKIKTVRRSAKRRVLVDNVKRIMESLDIGYEECHRIILVGGSVLDFELSNILTEEMDKLKVTAGKGNIRGCEGPRNAVATGLILDYCERKSDRRNLNCAT